MKKIVSLLLVIASLLSLTACGGNSAPTDTTIAPDNSTTAPIVSDPESNPTDPTTETTPEAEPFRFAGTWRKIPKTTDAEEPFYIIDEDGNMRYCINVDSKPSKYSFNGENTWDNGSCTVYFKNGYLSEYLNFHHKGDLYYAETYDSYGVSEYYYREEDYTDYNVIDLTPENVTQYIETSYCIWYDTNVYDDITNIYVDKFATFKEGLGVGSFVFGDLTYTTSYRNLTYNPTTGEYTIGESDKQHEPERAKKFLFCAADRYGENSTTVADKKKNDDGTYLLLNEPYYEFTGAEKVIGKVFVPKGWNG